MAQIQLIYSMVEWERRLELNEDRRNNHRSDSYVNFLAAPRPNQKEQASEERRSPLNFVKALISYAYFL